MKSRIALAALTFVFFAAPSGPPTGTSPVIVELFTSQGCSSCPPADVLLSDLAKDPSLRGKIIPLAFHVDYWDRLGWRDPFSAREWSARQYAYVGKMKLSGAYTPQVVVNGSRQMIGSNRSVVLNAIAEESKRKVAGKVRVAFDGKVATIHADAPAPMNLVLVLVEDGAITDIARGENSGLKLKNDSIVRRLYRLGEVKGKAEQKINVDVDPAWNRSRLTVVAFLQDRESLRIDAAGSS